MRIACGVQPGGELCKESRGQVQVRDLSDRQRHGCIIWPAHSRGVVDGFRILHVTNVSQEAKVQPFARQDYGR